MADIHDKLRQKVNGIFAELAGDSLPRLQGPGAAFEAMEAIASALKEESGYREQTAQEIGFHLADWNSEAAFLVAIYLFPERFTKQEIEEGVTGFLIHAPNHIAAAAKLIGYPIRDIFEVGVAEESKNDDS